MLRPSPAAPPVGDEPAGERRAHVRCAAHDLPNRVNQLLPRMILAEVSGGARPQEAQGIWIPPLHVQYEHAASSVAAPYLADESPRLRAAEPRVEQYHVDFSRWQLLEHLVRCCRLADDFHVGALCDYALQAFADDPAVVSDQQLDPVGPGLERRVGRHSLQALEKEMPR